MDTEFTVIETETSDQWEASRRERWSRNVSITDAGVELAREETPTYVAPESVSSIASVDVDVDRCGARYLLDTDGALYRATAADESFTRLPCDDLAARGATPEAFCIAGDVIYVVGSRPGDSTDERQGYVQTLSVRLRQTRWIVDRIGDIAFRNPIRVVRGRSTPGVYVLDCGRDDGDGFVARVTADGRARTVVSELQRPRDVAVADGGPLFVLDAEEGAEDSWVLRGYPTGTDASSSGRNENGDESDGEEESEAGDAGDAGDEDGSPDRPLEDVTCIEAVGGSGFVVGVGSEAPGERSLYRYVGTPKSVERLSSVSAERLTQDAVERLSSYRQSCARLRRGGGHADPPLYAIDGDSRHVWVLEPANSIARREYSDEERATAANDRRDEYAGRFVARFDLASIEADRYGVNLEYGDVPPGTRVVLRYATTDREIPDGDCDCSRSFECDGSCIGRDADGWTTVETSNPSDVLVPGNGRRFLWLVIDLLGSQFASPTVRSLKLSLSHESYVHYLPTIYQDRDDRRDETSATFLERFLAVFEDAFGDVDHAITTLTRYFDPESIPTQVSWLGSWLAVAEDQAWSERSKRQLIEEAPNLFKRRGTREGLLRLLEIYLDGEETSPPPWKPVSNVDDADYFLSLLEYRDVVGDAGSTNGTGATVDPDPDSLAPFEDLLCCPQEFVVLLGPAVGENARETVERIVESERPAHTTGRTVSLRSWGRLGDHVYLGVNSLLPPREFVLDESRLGWDSVVDRRASGSQIGDLSRVGTDLELI